MPSAAPISATPNPLGRVVQGFIALASGEIVNKAIAFVVVGYLGRTLTPDGYGLITFATTLAAYFVLVVDLGLDSLAARELARDPTIAGAFIRRSITVRVVLAAFVTVVYVLIAFTLPYSPGERFTIALYALLFMPYALTPKGVLFGLERRQPWAAAQVMGQILFAIGCLAFIRGVQDSWMVPAAQAVADVLQAAVVLAALRPHLPALKPLTLSWWGTVRETLPLALAQGMRILGYTFDILVIGLVFETIWVGYYGGAYKIVLVFLGFGALYTINLLPAISRYYPGNLPVLRALAGQNIALSGAVVLPIAVGGSILAYQGITFYYTSAYAEAVTPFRILMATVALTVLGGTFRSLLIGTNRQRLDLIVVASAGIANVALNLVLVPRLSPPAALAASAWITVATEAFIVGASWLVVQRSLGALPVFQSILPAAASCAVLALVLVGLLALAPDPNEPVIWLGAAFASGLAYLATLWATGGVQLAMRRPVE